MGKPRFNPKAQQDLNASVTGLLDGKRSVKEVCASLEGFQRTEGIPNVGVTPGSTASASIIIKEHLQGKLRNAASGAILPGKKKLRGHHLQDLRVAFSDAKTCQTGVDEDSDFPGIDRFVRNLKIKFDAAEVLAWDELAAARLVRLLANRCKPTIAERKVQLSDATLVVICEALLRMIRGDMNACRCVAKMGIVNAISKLALGFPAYGVHAVCPEHPELQMVMADILAEVSIMSIREELRKRRTLAHASALIKRASRGRMESFTNENSTADTSEAQDEQGPDVQCMEILLQILKSRIPRNEHASVWGVLLAMQRLAEDNASCRRLLLHGAYPALQEAKRHYATLELLDPALKRPLPKPPCISLQPPDFAIGRSKPALHRGSATIKDGWLQKSQSLTDLQASLPWRTHDFDCSLSVSSLESSPGAAAASFQRSRGSTQRRPHTMKLPPVKPASKGRSLPSLMWLVKEDEVDDLDFHRVCDPNLMKMQLHRLIETMEKVRIKLVAPFASGMHRRRLERERKERQRRLQAYSE